MRDQDLPEIQFLPGRRRRRVGPLVWAAVCNVSTWLLLGALCAAAGLFAQFIAAAFGLTHFPGR
jgi:hypothetical protein